MIVDLMAKYIFTFQKNMWHFLLLRISHILIAHILSRLLYIPWIFIMTISVMSIYMQKPLRDNEILKNISVNIFCLIANMFFGCRKCCVSSRIFETKVPNFVDPGESTPVMWRNKTTNKFSQNYLFLHSYSFDC